LTIVGDAVQVVGIDLQRAGELGRRAGELAELGRVVERAGHAGVLVEHAVELGGEGLVGHRLLPGDGELVEGLDQRLGHCLARLIMAGKLVEHWPGQQPILIHLAWIFDEVARAAAERRIFHVAEIIMNGVAEFMPKRFAIVEADQHRLAG